MSPEEIKKPVETEADSGSGDPIESLFVYITGSWKEVLAGLVIAAVAIGSVMLYQHKARTGRERAFAQLAMASTASQFNEIVRQFPSTKAAEMASLMAARTQYDSGNYGDADQLYADFISRHPKHYMVPAATLGRLHCQEAIGQTEESLAGYRQFVKDYPVETALGMLAKLGEARCLRVTGKLQEALSLYDQLLLEDAQGEWKPMIEDLKSTTAKDFERLPKTVAPAPAA